MKFALIANPEKYSVASPLQTVLAWCKKHHVHCFAEKSLYDFVEIKPDNLFSLANSNREAVNNGDMVIAIGGDGTLLHAAQLIRDVGIPILGINCGRLGFMANIQQDRIEQSLNAVNQGEFKIDERLMLEAAVTGSGTCYALNDILFTKKDTTSLISLTASYDDHFVNRYWADGLIVASPTGSTAYNLSSGGPIVMPGTPVMLLTPINPHTLTTRSLVLPSDKTLTISVEEDVEHVLFSCDGKILKTGGRLLEVQIRQSRYCVKLIQFKGQNYFDTLRTKLMWGLDSRKGT